MFRKIVYIRCLFAWITCACVQPAMYAQVSGGLIVTQVDLRQFAAHPSVYKIEQDKHGFIWMASDFGLYRFDGMHVRHYTKSAYPGLPSDYISSILIDHDDRLWIASDRGLAVMDSEHGIIEPYALEPGDVLLENLIPTCLFLASDSTVWIGLNNNKLAWIKPGKRAQIYEFERPSSPLENCYEIVKMFEDTRGDIVMHAECVHNNVILHVDLQHSQPTVKMVYNARMGVSRLFGLAHKIFHLSDSGIDQFDTDAQQFERSIDKLVVDDHFDFNPTIIKEENETAFWIGGPGGQLMRGLISQDTLYTTYVAKIADARVRDIVKDRSGCIWLGTEDGVFYITYRNRRFVNYLSSSITGERYGLKMRAIVENRDGFIYACASKGLYRINPVTSDGKQIQTKRIDVTQPYSMCPGMGDYLWVGSDGYGLMKYDTRTNEIYDRISVYSDTENLKGTWIGELMLDSDSTLWIGTNNGISYRMKSEDSLHITIDFNHKPLLSKIYTHDIKELRKGQYWLGTSQGLYQMTRVGRLPDVYFILIKYDDVPYKIREICMTEGSDIWLATEDAGLVQYHPGDKTQNTFTEANGLPSDVLYSLLPGPAGEFWIGTFDGLARFDTTTQLFSNYYVSDGLPHNEFNSQSQLVASDGKFYMGTQNGIVSFKPEDFKTDSSDLPVMIDGVSVHNTRLDTTYFESRFSQLIDGVFLGPHDNLVTISYSIADYNKLDGNRFQYLLEGLYTKWHYVGNQTDLVLPHLPAGDYTLHIRGAGSDGRWSTQQVSIPISVRAAYYNTWWFRMAVLVSLVVIMWLIYRFRLSQILKLQSMRLRIAEDLHDELGSSLTGIGIQTELLTATESSPKRISRLKEISGHIQDAVSKLGDIVWSLQSDTGSLGELIDRVEEQAHMILGPGQVECNISLPHESRDVQLNEAVKQNCFLIVKEALTNIFKHSNANRVDIIIRRQDKGLFLSIADNGNGQSSTPTTMGGNGLKNMQRRAEKMVGVLKISRDDGFHIELLIPNAFTR